MTCLRHGLWLCLPLGASLWAQSQSAKIDYICEGNYRAYAQFNFDANSGEPLGVEEFEILSSKRRGKNLSFLSDHSDEDHGYFASEGRRYKLITSPAVNAKNVRSGIAIQIFDSIDQPIARDCKPIRPEKKAKRSATALDYLCAHDDRLSADYVFSSLGIPANVILRYQNRQVIMKIDLRQSSNTDMIFLGRGGLKLSGAYIGVDSLGEAHRLNLHDKNGGTVLQDCTPEL